MKIENNSQTAIGLLAFTVSGFSLYQLFKHKNSLSVENAKNTLGNLDKTTYLNVGIAALAALAATAAPLIMYGYKGLVANNNNIAHKTTLRAYPRAAI